MSDEKNPAAFPGVVVNYGNDGELYPQTQEGMSLRDWFAGQVVAVPRGLPLTDMSVEDMAEHAEAVYRMADALLEARR